MVILFIGATCPPSIHLKFIQSATSVTTKCDDFSGVSGASNQSYEHKIRAYLLDDYDKTVRPVLGNKSVEVSFSMKISRLVKVVSKK